MRSARWVWLVGYLGVAACGGRQITGESSSTDAPTTGAGGTGASGSTTGSSGSTPIGPEPDRCSYGATTTPTLTAIAAPAVVEARIERFILGEANAPPSPLPD